MNKLDLDNYLKLKYELEKVLDYLICKDNEIEIIIYDLSEILKENLFIKEGKILFDFIKNTNNYSSHIKENLIELLENLYFYLISNYKINVYFYGKDKLGLLNKKYLNVSINSLENYYEDKNIYNVLILENKKIDLSNYSFDKIYDYHDIFYILQNYCKDIYNSKTTLYEYYYLKHELCTTKNENTDTLITGISYTLHGIKKDLMLNKSYSLALGSQDLYYAYKMARQGITFNKNIKRCIIGIGYYSLYFDTSLSGAKSYSPMVYEKLINDLHNFDFSIDDNIDYKEHSINYENLIEASYTKKNNPTLNQVVNIRNFSNEKVINYIFKFNSLQEDILYSFYSKYKSYYNEEFNNYNDKIYNGFTFYESNLENKIEVSKFYANHHSRHIKHKKTREENYNILNEFLDFLTKNNVEPIIIVFPFTKYYNEMLIPDYKIELYDVIDEFKKTYDFKFIDLNEYGEFDDTDFFDQDHLNEKGGIKATKYINELIYKNA